MDVSILNWLGWEFIQLRVEAENGKTREEQGEDCFTQCKTALKQHGLTLSNTVRSRVWGVDAAARTACSDARFRNLSGNDRAASSSYAAPDHFHSDAFCGLDLIAVKPRPGIAAKTITEYEPKKPPICWITHGPLLVCSGNTSTLETLELQVTTDILPRITQYLATAGSSWQQVGQVSCYLHKSQKPEDMRNYFRKVVPVWPPRFEIVNYIEGYSSPGKLVEVEVTGERKG
jgi:enamine deaminase RidA (YjgF/YER057c/UK114 family)